AGDGPDELPVHPHHRYRRRGDNRLRQAEDRHTARAL
ncbi:MAG: hypothetical protein AVDCRST_MAG14-1806, partial [uncultured Rubrobacteraceae bacterium]